MPSFVKTAQLVYVGASTDTKPTGVELNTVCREWDTNRKYVTYDGNNWVLASPAIITSQAVKIIAAAGNYDANDVISESAANGTSWVFNNIPPSGYIIRANILYSKAGGATNIDARTSLLLFTAPPTSMLNDNVANTAVLHADVANYIGSRIDFPAMTWIGTAGTASSESTCTPSTPGNLPLAFNCAPGSTRLYGILVAIDSEADETAGSTITITLQIEL